MENEQTTSTEQTAGTETTAAGPVVADQEWQSFPADLDWDDLFRISARADLLPGKERQSVCH